METSAYIRTDTQQHGYGRADNACAWEISRDAKVIFEADDRGDAVFITDENSLHDLEMKFPASVGFTYFMDFRVSRSYYHYPKTIAQYRYPIARKSTSWDAIFKEVERSGMVLVPEKNRFQYYDSKIGRNVDPYGKEIPPKTYRTEHTSKTFATSERIDRYTNLYGFDSNYIGLYGEVFHGFVRVIKDPKRAKRLQGYLRRSEARKNREPRPLQIDDISITQLRELLKAFVTEYVPLQNFVCVSSFQPNKDFYQGISSQSQQRDKTRRLLIKEINGIRQACIRSRRKWREMSVHHKSFVYYRYGKQSNVSFFYNFLNQYMQYVPILLKSKNPDFQAFGRWLRYEQALEKRRLKQEELEAEQPAKAKKRKSAAKSQKKSNKRRAAKKKVKSA